MNSALATIKQHEQTAIAHPLNKPSRTVCINVTEEKIKTVIAIDAEMEGNLVLKHGIKMDGHMKGNLTFGTEDGLCIIYKTATLQGELRGPRAFIMGTVEGDIHIHGQLILAPSAMVLGNIYYDRLVVHDGAQISGSMNMNSRESKFQPPPNVHPTTPSIVRALRPFVACN